MTKEKMEKIALDMLTCKTLKEAAEANGISDSALRRLRKKQDFKEILSDVRIKAFEGAFDRVCGAASESVNITLEIMRNDEQPAAVRLAAVKIILDLASEYYDTKEILERVQYLEGIVGEIIDWP